MSEFFTPLAGVLLTLAVYMFGVYLFRISKQFFLFSPILVGIVLGVTFLKVFNISYEEYSKGGEIITFFLTPATLMYAIPLFNKLEDLKKNSLPIIISLLLICVYTVYINYFLAKITGAPLEIQKSVLTKSITAAMALPVTESLGGIKSISMIMINITAIIGFALGPWILKLARITNPMAQGLAMGTASHAMGAAKAIEMGETQAAMASLALVFNGILTAFTVPIIAKLLGLI